MDMAELIRLRVPGLRLRRGVERQFGEMADAVFDRLAPFLDREFAGLTESGREAVVNGVCDTFAAADLSDEAILVTAWMALAPFPPPALTRLTLQKCVLPDDPSALNFPGVEVDIS
ncbi:hypothetical protein AB0D59_36595 [Streptomyces sp. NPDC048417]|uniref:NACHT N-terminal Helical domain 1-containing protein n=1 Tax=Streptomyces sp. NPDC048417 TaxID=3155387 RepID=UPI00342CCE1B